MGEIIEGRGGVVAAEPNGERPTALATDPRGADRARGGMAVRAYLETLGSKASREITAYRLDAAARLLCEAHAVPPVPAEAIPWHLLRPADMDALAAALGREYAPATANATLSAVRGVLRSSYGLHYLSAEERDRLIYGARGKTHRIRGKRPPVGRALASGELRALAETAAADSSPLRGARDAALLAILYGGGLRRAEACALSVGDFDADAGALEVKRGKGAKWRRVPLAAGAPEAVAAWLEVLRAAGADVSEDAPLLRSVLVGDRLAGRMSGQGVGRALRRMAKAAKVKPLTAHDLRRTYAGDLLEAGADVVHVQHLLGHADPAVTAQYDRRPDAARQKAARLLRFPFVGAAA